MSSTQTGVSKPASHSPAATQKTATSWTETLAAQLAIMLSGTLGANALSFALSVLVARLLGPVNLASYVTVSATAMLIGQLNDLGLANAFAFYGRHRTGSVGNLLTILKWHLAFCLLIAAALTFGARVVGGPWLVELTSPSWFALVVVAFITLNTPAKVLPMLVLARGEYTAYVRFATFTVLFQLGGVMVAWAVAGANWRGFVVALTVAQAIVALWEFAFLRAQGGSDVETVTARECYGYGLLIKWAEVMKLINGRFEILLVAALLPQRQVGIYSIAVSFRELGMTPLRAYAGILQNMLVDRVRRQSADRELVLGSILLQGLLSAGLAAGAWVVFPFALPLVYGRAFAESAGPAALLFCSTIFLSIAGLCWTVFNMRGRPGVTSAIVTISGLAGPLLVWILTRRAGLYGAAAASVLSALIACVASLIALSKLRGYGLRDFIVVVRKLPSLVGMFRRARVQPSRAS